MLISDLPIYDAPNYAPTKPLLDLREVSEPNQNDLNAQIKAKVTELNNREKGLFDALAQTTYIISSFIQGKQQWQRNWFNNGNWDLVRPPDTNPSQIQCINSMQFQVSQMLEDIASSNPDFEPEDMFKSYEYQKKVKAQRAMWNNYERVFYDGKRGTWFNIQQGLSLITSGTAIEELVYDTAIKGVQVLQEMWGTVQIPISEGGGRCYNCGFNGKHEDFHQWEDPHEAKEMSEIQDAAGRGDDEAKEMVSRRPLAIQPQCSKCGSFETDVQEPESMAVPSVTSMESVTLGDFRLNNLSILATRFNPAVLPEESSYLITKQYFPLGRVKQLFGRDVKIPPFSTRDVGLDYLYRLSRIGTSIAGARMDMGTGSDRNQSALLMKVSMSAEELADIDIPNTEDLRTVSGVELTPGQTLADICPEGATIVGFNDMDIIYGIYPKHHSKSVSTAVYFAKANSGTGRGAEDLAEIQKRKNRLDAQQVAAVDGASPGFVTVEGAFDEKHLKRIGFPNAKVPMRKQFFAQVKDISKAFRQFDPQQVAPQFFEYAQELDKLMQMTAHVVTMSGAVYDANNRTATGARILEETGQKIMIPMLMSKASMRQGTRRNLFYAYKDNFTGTTRTFSMGLTGNRHFSKIDVTPEMIDPEMSFVIVENSIIPQNYYVRKSDFMQFLNAVTIMAPQGGIAQLKIADPEMLSVATKTFNVDIGADEFDQITEINRLRMEDAFQLAELFEGMMGAMDQMPAAMPQQMAPPPPQISPIEGHPLTPEPEIPDNGGEPGATEDQMLYQLIFTNLEQPIKPKEKDLKLKAEWFQDYLDTPEGFKLPAHQRDICFEFVLKYEDADMMGQSADQGQAMLAGAVAGAPTEILGAKVGQMMGTGEEETAPAKPAAKKTASKTTK